MDPQTKIRYAPQPFEEFDPVTLLTFEETLRMLTIFQKIGNALAPTRFAFEKKADLRKQFEQKQAW